VAMRRKPHHVSEEIAGVLHNHYNRSMGGLLPSSQLAPERDTSKRTIIAATGIIVVIAGILAFVMRQPPRPAAAPPAYAANLKFSDLKMSQAQNFVGATVTYVDGTLTNTGGKSVTHADVKVTFKDFYNQVAQIEHVPVKLLRTTGPYLDAVDLVDAPLGPGQSKPFRLIFEHLSSQWNQAYPDLQVSDLTVR
jgi:Protein of unknown function (DUF2393)